MSIARAVELLREQQNVEALHALLDAWRASRDPRIADLIDLVAETVTSRTELPRKTATYRDSAWRELASHARPEDLGRLLLALWPTRWRAAGQLLDLLDKFPDDPRLAAALVRTAQAPPYTSKASAPFWKLVFERIGRLRDVRGLDAMRALPLGQWMWRDDHVREAVRALEATVPHALAADDVVRLDEIRGMFAEELARRAADAARGAALLSAVYAEPHDDGPRAVYADWLTEHGDPRGEFITLQLARGTAPPTPREQALLKEHGHAWLGSIGDLFYSPVFERGFLVGGFLRPERALGDSPELRLIRRIDFYGTTEAVAAVLGKLPSLASLATTANVVVGLARTGRTWPNITSLGVTIYEFDTSGFDALARCTAFPAVRELRVICRDHEDGSWIPAAPVLARLERLVLMGPGVSRLLVESVLARKTALRALEIAPVTWVATFTRSDPAAPFDTCTITAPAEQATDSDLALTLNIVPPIARLVVDPGDHELDAATLRRHPNVEILRR